jgi:diguanylate cyclase (GGDEF)-like protein
MEKWIALINDVCVIIFDLLLYTQMTVLRGSQSRSRKILYAGCAVIVAFYTVAVFVLGWAVSISAFVCMTLPSLALFFALSKYRDARFFLTFCFVDTVSLIVGYITRYVGIVFGEVGGIAAIVLMLIAFVFVYKKGTPYFARYRELLEYISTGWKRLTFTAAFIYIVLIFLAAYPRPLIERPEYFIPYMALSVMVLSFYVVFITNIIISEKVYRQSLQLKEQQKWFRMAYVDALTEIPNRMAYMEKVHELERAGDCTELIAVIMMDMDNFKKINDTLGHNAGDEALKHAAKYLSSSFSGDGDTVYRVGGDEFAAIVIGADKDEIVEKLKALDGVQKSDPPFSISYGYSFVDRSEDNAVNQAFKRADAMMYVNKTKKSS